MKKIVIAMVLGLYGFAPFFACAEEGQKRVVTFPVIETPKNEYREATKIEPGVIVSSCEIFYGDSIFLVHTAKNVAEDKGRTMAVPGIFDFQYNGLKYRFTAEGIDGSYHPMWESGWLGHADYFYPELFLEPNETGITSGVELEMPPLDEWNHPFWKAIRENLPPEGRTITLTFRQYAGEKQYADSGSVEILINPRPQHEMETLQTWFDSVPQESFPIERNLLYGYPVKGPRDEEKPQIPLSQRSEANTEPSAATKPATMELGGKSYPIASFLRLSHRKPPRDSAPTSLDDWRKLRDSFAKSTLRTDWELTVLKMEYLDAFQSGNPKPQEDKRDEILAWIRSQPDDLQPWWALRAQSVALMTADPYGREIVDPDRQERSERGFEFLRALYPMLHPENQKNSRNYIPEMKAEDEKRRDDQRIAHGITEQEKAEGYRFWFQETGKLLCKGKLIAIGKTQAMIREEYGTTYTSTIATLSEDDQKYIREKETDAAWKPDINDSLVRQFLDQEKERELTEKAGAEPQQPIAQGKILRVYPSSGGDVYSVSYSQDGALLLTTGIDKTAKLWNAKTGELVQVFRAHDSTTGFGSTTRTAAISPDGKHVLTSAGQDRVARLWDVQTGEEIRQYPISHWNSNTVLSHDGKYFFTTDDWRVVRLFSVETGEKLIEFAGHDDPVRSMAVSPDGIHLLTGSSDGTARLWDIDSAKPVWTAKLGNWVTAVAFTPDGKYVVTGTNDRGIHLLDAQSGEIVKEIADVRFRGFSLAVTPDGKELIAAVNNTLIHVYSIPDGKFLRGFYAHDNTQSYAYSNTITDLSIAPDGDQFATCGLDGNVKIWDRNTSQLEEEFRESGVYQAVQDENRPVPSPVLTPLLNIKAAHPGPITNARISPDGSHLLFADNLSPRVVETSNGQEIFRLNRNDAFKFPIMEFLPDGQHVFIFNTLYETKTGFFQQKYDPGNVDGYPYGGYFYSLSFSKDDKKLLLGHATSRTFIWQSDSEKPACVFQNAPPNNIGNTGNYNVYTAFLDNETKILSVRHAGEVFVWDIASGTSSRPFSEKSNSGNVVTSVAHSGDEKYIVLCYFSDTTVLLRDLKTGQLVKTFSGHDGTVLDVAFSPDSRFLLTGSADKTARLWDVETGQCVKIFAGHTDSVGSVRFSADGKHVVTGSEDGTVILWE